MDLSMVPCGECGKLYGTRVLASHMMAMHRIEWHSEEEERVLLKSGRINEYSNSSAQQRARRKREGRG
jgi:hypothetical protein